MQVVACGQALWNRRWSLNNRDPQDVKEKYVLICKVRIHTTSEARQEKRVNCFTVPES
jgi:hypothetical protein